MKKVFLSHAADRDSIAIARLIAATLAESQVQVYSTEDRGFLGQATRELVQDAIKQCSVLIALVTRPSYNVFYEIGYAEGIGRKIILLTDMEVPIPSDLNALTMVKFDRSDSSFLSRLLETIERENSQSHFEIYDNRLHQRLISDTPEEIFDIYRNSFEKFERIDNRTFEEIVSRLFEVQGFKVERQPSRSSASFDFAVYGFEGFNKIVVEVKKYSASSKISVGQAQQLLGAVVAERSPLGILIAPSEFTGTAIDFASKCSPRIELWNMDILESRLGYKRMQ